MPETKKIRIPVAIDPQGRWLAYGWPNLKTHAEMLDAFDHDTIGPNEKFYWVTVELLVPLSPEALAEEVHGKVESV